VTDVGADVLKRRYMTSTNDADLILDGWMRVIDDNRMQLLGARCEDCGIVAFPRPTYCPACSSDQLVEAILGPHGVLYSITVDRVGGFLRRPHVVGQVAFGDGPIVQGYVDAEIESPPAIGTAVEVVPFEVRDGEHAMVTYAFRAKES
jgi:uncharacterized OB-fold protein